MKEIILNKGQYYYDKLPIGIQKKFKDNFVREYSEELFYVYLERTKPNHDLFIGCAFAWRKTPEMEKYWKQISKTTYL